MCVAGMASDLVLPCRSVHCLDCVETRDPVLCLIYWHLSTRSLVVLLFFFLSSLSSLISTLFRLIHHRPVLFLLFHRCLFGGLYYSGYDSYILIPDLIFLCCSTHPSQISTSSSHESTVSSSICTIEAV